MNIEIDGEEITAKEGRTILDICREHGKEIPTKCYLKDLLTDSRCRVCLVEMNGKLVTSCSSYPKEGSKIYTDTEKVLKAREKNLELMKQEKDSSEAYKLFKEVGIGNNRFDKEDHKLEILGQSLLREMDECVNCGRCVNVCDQIQGVNAIDFAGRGHESRVTPHREKKLSEVSCIRCGQCILRCEENALKEKSHLEKVEEALADDTKYVVAQTAPAVRASLGELFDIEPGRNVEGEMVSALRKKGFDSVFDTVFGADLTIVEEASELIERIKNNGPFPMITSCCPAWILYMEQFHPELMENVSSCKSPHMMVGALTKTFFADKLDKKRDNIVVVSIMPCTSKKFEVSRVEMKEDVDYVLTTRETAKMLKKDSIDLKELDTDSFDKPLGISTGAGKIFGATGGVMEAAIRTANDKLDGGDINFRLEEVRGEHGIKRGEVDIGDQKVRFIVAHGGKNIEKTIELLDDGEEIHFIEFMACPGGCVCGGGQPKSENNLFPERAAALYISDENADLRLSHNNPAVKKVYEDFLDEPLSEKSEKLLHTFYIKRNKF